MSSEIQMMQVMQYSPVQKNNKMPFKNIKKYDPELDNLVESISLHGQQIHVETLRGLLHNVGFNNIPVVQAEKYIEKLADHNVDLNLITYTFTCEKRYINCNVIHSLIVSNRRTQLQKIYLIPIFVMAGCNINYQNSEGFASLHYACLQNQSNNLIKKMLELGAAVNIKTKKKMTPLAFAVKSRNFEMIKLLIESGANITYGKSPIKIAKKMGLIDIKKYLNQQKVKSKFVVMDESEHPILL